jgi:hypothetical protein
MTPEIFMSFATPLITLLAVTVSHLMTEARDAKTAAADKAAHDAVIRQVEASSANNAQQSASLTVQELAPAVAKIVDGV